MIVSFCGSADLCAKAGENKAVLVNTVAVIAHRLRYSDLKGQSSLRAEAERSHYAPHVPQSLHRRQTPAFLLTLARRTNDGDGRSPDLRVIAWFPPSRTQTRSSGTSQNIREKRRYPLTVAGTVVDLRSIPRTTFPFHPSLPRHHLRPAPISTSCFCQVQADGNESLGQQLCHNQSSNWVFQLYRFRCYDKFRNRG